MTLRDLYLICFAAASLIHGVQTVLAAKLLRRCSGHDRVEARDAIAIGVATFFWQCGNFLAVFVSNIGAGDIFSAASTAAFGIANFLRDASLVCFPLLFAYMYLHMPGAVRGARSWLLVGRILRYPLWPWTVLAVVTMTAGDAGLGDVILSPALTVYVTLHIMLLYFVIFTVTSFSSRGRAQASGVAALVRAHKATFIASFLAVATFILMLTGYWRVHIPLMPYIELAAMLTSVPFTISLAYRQYQFSFMDAFLREVLSGVILLAAFVAALAAGRSPVWIGATAVALAYAKKPLTRWVERKFLGYEESLAEQEERIDSAIRRLTRLDGPAMAEILAKELEAEWVEIDSAPRLDAIHRFQIAGCGLWLSLGLRTGGRQYMSRQLQLARTAALQLAAHHHQLSQAEMREVTTRAQIRALQAQINPHFLFNTLNVLANLIHTNPERAENVTEQLAEIFRYALESTRVEFVKLDDELRFLESYLEIEKARFEERLAYSFKVDAALRSLKIPSMILQPLVENAVKHGIGPKVEGGEITISARFDLDRVVIVVEDTGAGRQSVSRHPGTGIGLNNVRERLQHMYGGAGSLTLESLEPAGTRAVLTLPQLVGVSS